MRRKTRCSRVGKIRRETKSQKTLRTVKVLLALDLDGLGKVVAEEGGDLFGEVELLLDFCLVGFVALEVELCVCLFASGYDALRYKEREGFRRLGGLV